VSNKAQAKMQYQITTKTVEEYHITFPIKMEEDDEDIG
jgi:hypothetical protein